MRKAKALFFAAGLMFLSTSLAHADCTVTERLPWTKSGTEKLSIFAYSVGETCEGAVVGFLVVNSKGKAVWFILSLVTKLHISWMTPQFKKLSLPALKTNRKQR